MGQQQEWKERIINSKYVIYKIGAFPGFVYHRFLMERRIA